MYNEVIELAKKANANGHPDLAAILAAVAGIIALDISLGEVRSGVINTAYRLATEYQWCGETYKRGEQVEVSSNGEVYTKRTLDCILRGRRSVVKLHPNGEAHYMRKVGSDKVGSQTEEIEELGNPMVINFSKTKGQKAYDGTRFPASREEWTPLTIEHKPEEGERVLVDTGPDYNIIIAKRTMDPEYGEVWQSDDGGYFELCHVIRWTKLPSRINQ